MTGKNIGTIEEGSSSEGGSGPPDRQNDSASGLCSSPKAVELIQKVIAEAIGTYFVNFIGCGSVVVNKIYGSVTFPGICVCWGLIVMAMVYALGHISGAHFNPAVTITFALFRHFPCTQAITFSFIPLLCDFIMCATGYGLRGRKWWLTDWIYSWMQVPLYIAAQFIGSILASGSLYLLFDIQTTDFYGTVPVGSNLQSLVLEFIISFLLMFVISGVATDNRAIGELAGIAVGITILMNVFVAGPVSGASMNPARSIGPALIMHQYKGLWVYIVGPLLGTIAGGFAYNLIRFTDKPLRELTKSNSFLRSFKK